MVTQLLMITLGHNASAVLYNLKERRVIGYEQERLTRIKGDSQFPADALLEILKHGNICKDECIAYVSHWFPVDGKGQVSINAANMPNNKYFTVENELLLRSIAGCVVFCSKEFTHHDAHAYSVMAFRNHFANKADKGQLELFDANDDVFTIVADGFGNEREVLSIYKGKNLVFRKYGYGNSLGLMYQYATAFVGMKENQDEYKFLGYESHITKFVDVEVFEPEIAATVKMLITDGEQEVSTPSLDTEIASLENFRAFWYQKFKTVLSYFTAELNKMDGNTRSFAERSIIGYFIQAVVERTIIHYVDKYEMHDVNVAGGLFYNVKLNNTILTHIKGTFCPMPLAGDQGAAIGMAYYYNQQLRAEGFNFGNLCWGRRSFYNVEKALKNLPYSFYTKALKPRNIHSIAQKIADGNIVNIVGPDMEFGPRALCMTTTLFLPTAENTAANNHMNGRNEVMPCAPVCTKRNANIMFDENELNRVIGSDGYMICTHEYQKHVHYCSLRSGAMHVKPNDPTAYTGRPQIIYGLTSYMAQILNEVQQLTGIEPLFLVNTSFNVHGQPIVFDLHAIIENYKYQCEHAVAGKVPYLYIFEDYEK